MAAAKKIEAYIQSLWALFPAFCNFPSDTARSFGRVAKHVGGVLSEDPELRGVICQGLQVVLFKSIQIKFDNTLVYESF